MTKDVRINTFYEIDKDIAIDMFKAYDKSLVAEEVTSIHSGMSTSNYCITARQTKYLLKIYSGKNESIEPIMYTYLQKHIHIPTLYYYNDSQKICPYPYAIIQYIQGETLSEYIKRNCCYPIELVYEIGQILSIIHKKSYHGSGFLDKELLLDNPWKSTEEFIVSMLEGKPGTRVSSSTCNKLKAYMKKNYDIFRQIDSEYVLCHGDLGYGNILISDGTVYFIDFEYAMSESRYRDIGKFFRSKESDIQQYINTSIYKAFAEGYGGLPANWLQLAKVADIPVMLGLLNIDSAPQDWVDDIEHDILEAIS